MRVDETEAAAMRLMWGMVVYRHLKDARGIDVSFPGNTRKDPRARERRTKTAMREAETWLRSRDFREVCGLAGLDHEAVLRRFETDQIDLRMQIKTATEQLETTMRRRSALFRNGDCGTRERAENARQRGPGPDRWLP